MNGFLRRIATKHLGIPLEEYEDQTRGLSIEGTEEFLAIQANAKKQSIPDIKKIMESILNDQAMASRCHKEWLPPSVRATRLFTSKLRCFAQGCCDRKIEQGKSGDMEAHPF